MTQLYTRLLTAAQIELIRDIVTPMIGNGAPGFTTAQLVELLEAIQATPKVAALDAAVIPDTWAMRVKAGSLKGKAKSAQAEAYLQGVLACLTLTGFMSMERASQLGFMVSVGRIDQILDGSTAF